MNRKFNAVSLWFTILSSAASALNLLYYPLVAHLLNLAQFGDVQVGVSFIMQAAALFASLNLVALLLSARKESEEDIIQKLEQVLLTPSFVFAVLVSIFAHPISGLLQLHSAGLLYLLSAIFILNIPASTWIGTLQGEGAFIKSGAISLVSSFVKIIASTIFILFGLGAYGAILGIMTGTVITIPLCYMLQDSKSLNFSKTFRVPTKEDFRIVFKYKSVLIILISFVLFSLVGTFDVLFAKAHLSPIDAGRFAQYSIIAKIPYFALMPVSIILFGRFIKSPARQIRAVIVYIIGVLILSFVIYLTLPFVSQTLFSLNLRTNDMHITVGLLAAFGLYTITLLLNYLLISRKRALAAFTLAVISIFLSLVSLSIAATPEAIARNYAQSFIVVVLLSLLCLVYNRKYAKE